MKIRLYNTLSRRKEAFEPQNPERVTMYACGPTVYNYAHIGNARPAVIFDLLFRLLSRDYPGAVYARNITDVDDKINASAAEEGVPIEVVSTRYADAYHDDMAALGVAPPSLEPRATHHIPDIIDMITRLVESGHAYMADGHVLFDIQSFPDYGALSGRDREDMISGARVEVAEFKRHPGDFVLWKPSEDPLPGWDSPWGYGRPGWHIECSAMAEKHLGETIDIHAGGQDLTSMRAVRTWSFRTMRTKSRKASAPTVACPSRGTGCTTASSRSTGARCPSPWATRWSSTNCCSRSAVRRCVTSC
jgi:cysteinyl-tRNA synthetase